VDYFFVALVIAIGGALGEVAYTYDEQKLTPMAAPEAVTANLVAAALVALASPFALPVSTTTLRPAVFSHWPAPHA